MVIPNGSTPKLDKQGYPTGELMVTYSIPIKIRIPLYPATGRVVEEMFGLDKDLSYVSVTSTKILQEESLLFYTLPTEKFDTGYDLRVSEINESLNQVSYGLVNR